MRQRIGSRLELRQGEIDPKAGSCTWILQFSGLNKKTFEDLVAHKTDWSGIKLAIGRGTRKPHTCRGVLPDGSKPFIPDLTEFSVNMYGVRVQRLEDGFGTYQELDRQSTDIKGKRCAGQRERSARSAKLTAHSALRPRVERAPCDRVQRARPAISLLSVHPLRPRIVRARPCDCA